MPFGMMSGSVEGYVYSIGGGDHRRERGCFGVNLGRPIETNGDFATRLFPNYFAQDLFRLLCFSFFYHLLVTKHYQKRICQLSVKDDGFIQRWEERRFTSTLNECPPPRSSINIISSIENTL